MRPRLHSTPKKIKIPKFALQNIINKNNLLYWPKDVLPKPISALWKNMPITLKIDKRCSINCRVSSIRSLTISMTMSQTNGCVCGQAARQQGSHTGHMRARQKRGRRDDDPAAG